MSSPKFEVADIVRKFRSPLIAARGASVTPAQRKVLDDLAACRTPALGGHVFECEACKERHFTYNSCRNRQCPSCLAFKSGAWLEARRKELMPVPYFHVVFTVPEPIEQLALGNKRELYKILFSASARSLSVIARDPKHLGAQLGFFSVLHTWSQKLGHHPHVHCVVPGGGLSLDGKEWVACRPAFFLPVRVLSRFFRGEFVKQLQKARAAGKLSFQGVTAELAQDEGWARFIAKIREKEWVVYSKPPFGSPEQVLKYLASYTHRGPISNHRIVGIEENQVQFEYRDSASGNQTKTMSLAGVEFLRRLLLHVLPKGFTRIRHFGLLANQHRKEKLLQCRKLLAEMGLPALVEPVEDESELVAEERVLSDGELIKQGICPACGGQLIPLGEIPPTAKEEVVARDTS